MKKHVLVVLFLYLFSANFLVAQNFEGGVMGGFNGSQVEGDRASGYNKLGAVLGAWVQTDLPQNMYVGMELKFNQKGSRVVPTKKNGYWKYVYRLNYIDVPIVFGYQYSQSASVYMGGSFGYLLSKSGYDNFGIAPDVDYYDLKNWEVGILGGVKIDFEKVIEKQWAKNMVIDLRMQFSLLSTRYQSVPIFGNQHYGQYNNVLSTTLYYPINWSR